MYLSWLPRMYTSAIDQKRVPSCGQTLEEEEEEGRRGVSERRGEGRGRGAASGGWWRQLLTLDVQMTWVRSRFIQLSQDASAPLYVSPFFSSTSYAQREGRVGREDGGGERRAEAERGAEQWIRG